MPIKYTLISSLLLQELTVNSTCQIEKKQQTKMKMTVQLIHTQFHNIKGENVLRLSFIANFSAYMFLGNMLWTDAPQFTITC